MGNGALQRVDEPAGGRGEERAASLSAAAEREVGPAGALDLEGEGVLRWLIPIAFALVTSSLPRGASAQTQGARAKSGARHHAAGARSHASAQSRAAGQGRRALHGPVAKLAPRERPDSVGHPNEGRLEGGVHLDVTKPYVRVVPAYEAGDVRWGLPAMIGMIDRAAKGVARRYPGAVLGVGDISRRGGGEVMRHHSHESGRDADIGFYVTGPKGKPVLERSFVKFDERLQAPAVPGARFDLAKNWLLVQLMLTDPAAQVSHIFVSEPIRQRLLAHARSVGVSQRLLDRAAIAMMQPTGSLPHDDHFHVRISCPRAMRECIELAKETVRPRSRAAHAKSTTAERGRAGSGRTAAHRPPAGHRALRTPPGVSAGRKPASGATPAVRAPRASGLAAAAPSEPMDASDLYDSLRALRSDGAPARDPDRAEAEADAAVKRRVDETGVAKITD